MNYTDKAIDLLKQLISTPSLSKEEGETARLICLFFEAEGISYERSGHNVWVRNKAYSEQKPTLLLNSHHDTVKPNAGYTKDPFRPEIQEGKLYGLGSNDAGGALVSLLATFLHYYPQEDLRFNLLFAATAEEEISGKNGIASILESLGPIEVAIVGEPNVGKSTLLNYLARRDVAITSDIAGTTRDVIEVQMDFGGVPVTILDTAGLRETDDKVEGLGVARAKMRAEQADIRIHMVLDASDDRLSSDDDIVVHAKSDLSAGSGLAVSGKTGAGVDALIAKVRSRLETKVSQIGVAMRERHRLALVASLDHIEQALSQMANCSDLTDLIAEDLHSAIRAVDSIVGRVDVEHVLDEIFSSFCIGK